MSEKITLEMVAQEAGLLKVLEKVSKEIDKLDKKAQKIGENSAKTSKAAESGFQKFGKAVGDTAKSLTGVTSGIMAATAVLAGFNKGIQDTIANSERMRNQQLSAGQALREMKVNFSPDKTIRDEIHLEKEILAIAERRKATVGDVARVASSALSASTLSNAETLKFVDTALQFMPGNPDAADELASRALDIAKITGNKNAGQNIGALIGTQGASRITELSQLGSTVMPPLNAAVLRGDTAEQGLEMFAALTQLIGDKEGRTTGTAQIALIEQLNEFAPLAKFQGPTAKAQELQRNPELRKLFLSGGKMLKDKFEDASFEKKASAGIESFLSNTAGAMEAQANAAKKILPLQQSGKLFDEKLRMLSSGEFQDTVSADLAGRSNVEEFQLQGGIEGRQARARAIFESTVKELDLAGIDEVPIVPVGTEQIARTQLEARLKTGTAPEQAAIKSLREIRDDPVGPQTGKSAELINKQIELLEKIEKNTGGSGGRGAGQKPPQPAAAINSR
ncbi:MAG TPA: hypothetical protein VLA12_05555 [Planctomycetaceae bacterium]|nr:hypothetical protein [Planctomycetaceae bacterium]